MDWIKAFVQEHVSLRATRSGASFSKYYTVNNPDFDLDALLEKRCQEEQDEADLVGAEVDESAPGASTSTMAAATASDPPSPLSSAPSTPSPSRAPSPSRQQSNPPSPLSSAPSTPSPSRAPSPTRPGSPDLPPSKRARRQSPSARAHYQFANPNAHKSSKKRRSRLSRQKRAQKRAAGQAWDPPGAAALRNSRHLANAKFEGVDLNWNEQPATRTGFTSKRDCGEAQLYTLDDLVGPNAKVPGMKLVNWDGRETTGICAQDERVFGVCAGRPDGEWDEVHGPLADELAAWGARIKFPADAREHRRGNFGAQAYGVSHGGGQIEPAVLKHTARMNAMLTHLLGLTAMIRIAHFASSVFFNWAPRLWMYYAKHMQTLFENDPTLQRNFAKSVWACITINFGPRTVTYKHRDFGNLAYGWCAITALGKYDPDRGGHLVLWECGLVIRFPPGSTIIIPSSIIHHSNTTIAPEETRYSVTQYTTGAIFRWVQHGCMLDDKYYSSLSPKERAEASRANANRWREGAKLWSTIPELQNPAMYRMEVLEH
ncbi:hypothetical protein EV715DRAFT_295468 [Schizophyllum commune]